MAIDLYTIAKLALLIMGYDLGDFGISKNNFEFYFVDMQKIYNTSTHECHIDLLKSKIDVLHNRIIMLRIYVVEFYKKIIF